MMNEIFKTCLGVASLNKISAINAINIEVGDFALFVEIYAHQAFDSLKKNTIAENAVLNIQRTPGILHCKSCNQISEIWFDKEKEKAAMEGRLEEYEQYEKVIIEETILRDIRELGREIFHCRKCNSPDTNLIKGKEVLIKSIVDLPLVTV